jgi:hypothetical protein
VRYASHWNWHSVLVVANNPAGNVPASRAARTDPLTVLREE